MAPRCTETGAAEITHTIMAHSDPQDVQGYLSEGTNRDKGAAVGAVRNDDPLPFGGH